MGIEAWRVKAIRECIESREDAIKRIIEIALKHNLSVSVGSVGEYSEIEITDINEVDDVSIDWLTVSK